MQLDGLDAGILRLLLEDARLSYREIAGRLDSTTPTVSARVKSLEELGILVGYRAEVNSDLLGGPLRVLRIQCRPAAAVRIAIALAQTPGMERVEVLAGGRVEARLRERVHDGIRAPHELLSGDADVVSYELTDVLSVPRVALAPLDLADVDVPCHQCKGPIHGAPVRAKLEGRAHVFCCTHCLDTFKQRLQTAKRPSSPILRKDAPSRHRH